MFYIFATNQKLKAMAELKDFEKKVYEALKTADKELKTGEIAELAGIDKKIVSKAITKLKKMDMIYSPKRCYYKAK